MRPLIVSPSSSTGMVDTYERLRELKPPGWRERIRKPALDLISGLSGILDKEQVLLRRPRIQFLYIHHIFRDEVQALRTLVAFLARNHRFISYSEAVDRVYRGDIDAPYIVFSSDDGLRNNLEAMDVFAEFGISACFFICPAMVGEQDPQRVAAFCSERLHMPPMEFLNWKEVEHMLHLGHEIGGHTMHHVNFSLLGEDEAAEEIGRCREEVRSRTGKALHFAYPYGRFFHFPRAYGNLVFDAGFISNASAERGAHIGSGTLDPHEVLFRRDHIILDWPLRHVRHFLRSNARNAGPDNNLYPVS